MGESNFEKATPDDTLASGPRVTAAVSESDTATRIGPYRLLQLIGEGGMGEVWLAEQFEPRRKVAIKLIKAGMDTKQVVARFESERQALALMDHPAIAKVLDGGSTDQGRPYFVMEYVAGVSITDHCDTNKLSTAARLKLFTEVCEGVQHAHQKAIIHRDLKPSNILVSLVDGKPQPKIIDFGIAKATGYRLTEKTLFTELGAIIGTPEYMSPEQADLTGQDVDTRTDVYSLGVVLYQLLTGELPFGPKELRSSSYDELRRKLKEVEPLRPSTKLSSLGDGASQVARNRDTDAGLLRKLLEGDLDAITMKALEKERARRYGTPSELAADIGRHLRHEPVVARPPSGTYRLGKYIRRHRLGVGLAAGLATLLVAVAATMTVQARRTAMERDRANAERDRATAETEKVKAMNTFLEDALGSADPWNKGSRNISLLDALRQARTKTESAFQHQPLIAAALLETIGKTFTSLAEFTDAEQALRTSLDLRVRASGPRSAETAESLASLSELYYALRKYGEAEKSGREALAIAREVHGPAALETAKMMGQVAQVLGHSGQPQEAKELAEQMLRIARASPATDQRASPSKANRGDVEFRALEILSNVAEVQGDFETQKARARERLALARQLYPSGGVEVGYALADFGLAEIKDNPVEAERSLKECLQITIAALGEDNPEVASARENLASVYFQTGRYDETIRTLEAVLALRRRALGDDSEPVARTLANMGTVYSQAGNAEAAKRSYRESLERMGRKVGEDNLDLVSVQIKLGKILSKEGSYPEAEGLLRHGLEVRTKALGEGNPATQRVIQLLADLFTGWRKPEQAAAYQAKLVKSP
jgi:serine/threonine protein kinase/tetratricopeptide (TPR) repeat protein